MGTTDDRNFLFFCTEVCFCKIFAQIGLSCGGEGMDIKRWEGVKQVGTLQKKSVKLRVRVTLVLCPTHFPSFRFNVPCLYTPLLNLHLLIFGLMTFAWVCLLFCLGISFWFMPTVPGTQPGHKTRSMCVCSIFWVPQK